MACTVNKKAFCGMEFAKTESIVTVQQRFRTMYRTELPTDKTIREWYMKFQQSGCLCAAKRRGRPGPSAVTVKRVPETFVRSPQKSPRVHISSTCPRRKGPNFGRVFLRSNYTDITQNTYIQSSMVTEILAREV